MTLLTLQSIQAMKDGAFYDFDGGQIEFDDGLLVRGWSAFTEFANITRDSAMVELELLKENYGWWVNQQPTSLVRQLGMPKFILSFDDAGKAGVDICEERNDSITWFIKV